MEKTLAENRILRKLLNEKNDEIDYYKAAAQREASKLADKTEELETAEQEHQQNVQAMENEISELNESFRVLQTTRDLAVNTLHKKQKAFEKRKKHFAGIQLALSASQSHIAELKKENGALGLQVLSFQGIAEKLDYKMQENAGLLEQVRDLNEKVAEMKAEQDKAARENEEKKKLLLEKVRQWRQDKLNETLNLKNEVEAVRRMCETTMLADSQEKKELQEKLEKEKKELEKTKEELATCKLNLEQQNKCVKDSEEEIEKQNCVIIGKNFKIEQLNMQAEKLKNFILGARNAIGQFQGHFDDVVECNFFQVENAIENDANDDY